MTGRAAAVLTLVVLAVWSYFAMIDREPMPEPVYLMPTLQAQAATLDSLLHAKGVLWVSGMSYAYPPLGYPAYLNGVQGWVR